MSFVHLLHQEQHHDDGSIMSDTRLHHKVPPRGRIEVILGPMFSGKTTELLRRIRRFTFAKRRCLVIKYQGDVRYSQKCASTHDKVMHRAVSVSKLISLGELSDIDVVGIDEGQFYPDLVPFCESMANAGKVVIVAALDGTYQRQAFGSVLGLIPLAEHVIKLTAVCMLCQRTASFSSRITADQSVQLIGGSDKYISTCRNCFRATTASTRKQQPDTSAAENESNEADRGQTVSPSSENEPSVSFKSPQAVHTGEKHSSDVEPTIRRLDLSSATT